MLLLLLGLGGCAGLPPAQPHEPSHALLADGRTPLAQIAQAALQSAQPQGPTGVLPMPLPSDALDMRLGLIEKAQVSLDVQTFHLANDVVGHQMLRGLRDAARRGVRVRLLLDDFHTLGSDALLLGLVADPHVQVRLFNPFVSGRDSSVGRWMALASDFKRLNHRMHNKLFMADGAFAIVGGRNLADGYFQRDADANFIDFEALAMGEVLPSLAAIFDQYWNSAEVFELQRIASSGSTATELREALDAQLPKSAPATALALAERLPGYLSTVVGLKATAFADAPEKLHRSPQAGFAGTALARSIQEFFNARSELMLFTPYFVPGAEGMQGLKQARDHGVAVRVITNSMAATDEPLASMAYERYRVPLLEMGVELYEISSVQVQRDASQRALFGSSRARLHAKMAMVDRQTVLLGSINLDQRSATTNTELGVVFHSPELTQRIMAFFNARSREEVKGSYQVQLKPDHSGLRWVALLGGGRTEVHDEDPEFDGWMRARLWLMSQLVPESLL
jgi:putative cardiolipin synthase